jgi:hypothetical protein
VWVESHRFVIALPLDNTGCGAPLHMTAAVATHRADQSCAVIAVIAAGRTSIGG